MIGGTDIIISTRLGAMALETAVRAVWNEWTDAVFEDIQKGTRFGRFHEIPFGTVTELFAYRNASFSEDWDKLGAVPELADTMLQLLIRPDELTIVADAPIAKTSGLIIERIRERLNMDIFVVKATVRKAA